jgi:HK97 family phage major capsid protein
VPVASGIAAPNLKDLAIKVKHDITRDRGSKYSPDMVLVNSLTLESLILKKDTQNNYIFDENTGTVGGLFIVVDENTPNNQMIVGDRRYARIYEKTGIVLTKGMPNNQFNEDELTIKARKRMLLLVKNGDRTGFRKVTSISAALTTLAT